MGIGGGWRDDMIGKETSQDDDNDEVFSSFIDNNHSFSKRVLAYPGTAFRNRIWVWVLGFRS